jgi:hypothetical protein
VSDRGKQFTPLIRHHSSRVWQRQTVHTSYKTPFTYPCQTRLDWCLMRGVNCLPLSDTTWLVSYKRCELFTSVRHHLNGVLCEVWTAYPCQTRLYWCLIRGVNCLPLSDTTWLVSYKRCELFTSFRNHLNGVLWEVWTAYPCQTRLYWCLIRGVNYLTLSDTTWLFWCPIRGVNCLLLSDTTWLVYYKRCELLTPVRYDLTILVSYKRCELLTPVRYDLTGVL